MKSPQTARSLAVAFITAFLISVGNSSRAQDQAISTNLAQVSSVSQVGGTFWSMQLTNFPPFPFDPFPSLTLYEGAEGQYFYDDLGLTYPAAWDSSDWHRHRRQSRVITEGGAAEDDVPSPPGGGGGGGSGGGGPQIQFQPFNAPSPGYTNCETWTNFAIFLNFSSTSNLVVGIITNTLSGLDYVLLCKTNLTNEYWTAIQSLAATNSYIPFTVTNAPTNATLYFWAILSTNDYPPVITAPPSNQVVGLGTNVVFTVTASGYPAVSYQWQLDGTNIPGATTNSLTVADVHTNNVGLYTVVVSNILCEATANAGLGLIWTNFLDSSGITASPAVGPNGYTYIVTVSGRFVALDQFGTIKWSKNLNSESGEISSSPTVSADGAAVYVGDQSGYLWAVNATNGNIIWSNNLGSAIYSTPALGQDGAVYVTVAGNPGLYAINSANGSINWAFAGSDSGNGDAADSSPVVSQDCTISFTASSGDLYAVYPNGSLKWLFPLPGGASPDSSPALGNDGTVYVGSARAFSGNTYVYAINSSGGLEWAFDTGDNDAIQSSVALMPDNTVLIASTDGNLFAITNGVLKWKFTATNSSGSPVAFESSPAVTADNVTVIGSENNWVYGLTNGAVAWSFQTSNQVVSSPTINPQNGAVIVASEDGNVYQFPGTATLADSSWPMFHGNVFHSGATQSSGCETENMLVAFPNNTKLSYNSGNPNPFSFNLTGTPGSLWVVYAASNLMSQWTPIGSVMIDPTQGYKTFSDSTVNGANQRFYQAKSGTTCSRVVAFLNASMQPGANLVANQLYQNNDSEYPANTANGLLASMNDDSGYPAPPNGSQILDWIGNGFSTNMFYLPSREWLSNGDNTLLPGKAQFFDNPTNYTVTLPFAGWVAPGPFITNVIPPGTNFVSSILPQAGYLHSNLSYQPNSGDVVQLWTSSNFANYTYSGSWSPSEPFLNVGQGFVLVTAATNVWVQGFEPCSGFPLPSYPFTNSSGGTPILDSPAIDSSGNVYVATSPSEFYSVAPNGEINWSASVDSSDQSQGVTSSPTLSSNGSVVYIGSAGGLLQAFYTVTGSSYWSLSLGGEIIGTPCLQSDGDIVVGTYNAPSGNTNGVFSVSPTGGLQWAYLGNGGLSIPSSVLSGPDCTLYFMNEGTDPGLYALYPGGQLKWYLPMSVSATPLPPPALDSQGNIYVGNQNNLFECISPNGTLQWVFPLPDGTGVTSGAVIGPDLTAYFSDDDGVLWAVKNGALQWSFTNPTSGNFSTPALDANDVLYVGSYNSGAAANGLFALNEGSVLWQFATPDNNDIVSGPVLSSGGLLCFGTDGGDLFSLPAAASPTNAPWPMFQKNQSHGGADAVAACYDESCQAPFLWGANLNDSIPSFSFNVMGEPGTAWNVIASYSLTGPWFALGSVTLDASGAAQVSDSTFPPNTVTRFYHLTGSNCCSQDVGFSVTSIESGWNLLADPFIEVDNSGGAMNSLANLLSSTLNSLNLNGTQVQLSNAIGSGTYTFENTNGQRWFLNGTENEAGLLTPGQAAWLYNATTNPSYNVVFAGLLSGGDGGQVTNTIADGTNLVSSIIPESGPITSALNYSPHAGDTVELWNPANQSFSTFTETGSSWSPSEPILASGQGFVLITGVGNPWVETLPGCGSTNPVSPVLLPFLASPAIDPVSGEIYIPAGTNENPARNVLFALNPTNLQVTWSNNIFNNNGSDPQPIEWTGSASVGVYSNTRSIFVGDITATLFSFAPSGTTNWMFNLSAHNAEYGTPAIAANGTVYACVDETTSNRNPSPSFNGIWSISPTNGATNWNWSPEDEHNPSGSSNNGGDTDSAPIIAANGDQLFLSEAWRFHRISPLGHLLWFTPVPGDTEPDSTAAVDATGHIYVGSDSSLFYCLNPDGSVAWLFDTGASTGVQTAPAIDAAGVAYIAAGTTLFAVSNGVQLWQFAEPLGNSFQFSSPAVDQNGVVYIGSSSSVAIPPATATTGVMYAVKNGVMIWADGTVQGIMASPALTASNVVIGDLGGVVRVYPAAGPDPSAPWPQFMHDAAHTGQQAPVTTSDSDCGAPYPYDGALSGGQFSFQVVGLTNTSIAYGVYASTNLETWSNIGTTSLVLATNDLYATNTFTDTNAGNVPQKFYVLTNSGCCSRIIGFVNVPLLPGTNLIADQLCQVDDEPFMTSSEWAMNSLNALFDSTFTSRQLGAQVLSWNGQSLATNFFAGGQWTNGSGAANFTTTLLPGSSAIFNNVTNVANSAYTNTFIGLLREQQVMRVQPGFNYLSATFPMSGTVTNVAGNSFQSGDIIQLWSTNSHQFLSFTNISGNWLPSNPVVGVGQGFILVTTNSYTWTNTWDGCP